MASVLVQLCCISLLASSPHTIVISLSCKKAVSHNLLNLSLCEFGEINHLRGSQIFQCTSPSLEGSISEQRSSQMTSLIRCKPLAGIPGKVLVQFLAKQRQGRHVRPKSADRSMIKAAGRKVWRGSTNTNYYSTIQSHQ